MKRIFKVCIIIFILCIGCFFVTYVNVSASTNTPSKSNTLSLMNSSIDITSGMYDEYTNSEEKVNWADFYEVNLYNYYQEDYGYCGFFMDYTSKPGFFGWSNGEATIHGDDPIIYLVPKELFVHRGNYTYVGKEYGFFVNTTAYANSGELETANLVDVFMFDIITIYNNSEEKFTYTIRPLYTFTYIYLSDYIFYQYNEVTIDDVDISLDSEDYSSYSDAVIPIPRMSDDRFSNQYGATYIQNYSKTQPNKDLYAIKDTFAFLSLANVNSYNPFDSNYNIDSDMGYRIRRSYILYNGYGTSSVNVDVETASDSATSLLSTAIGVLYPPLGLGIEIAENVYDSLVVFDYMFGETHIGYELKLQTNNPSDVDKGGRNQQKQNNGHFWKFDAKSTSSTASNALIFRTLTYDDMRNQPVYNSISYCWHLDSESREEAYLTYGSRIQIAIANEKNDTYDEISIGDCSYFTIIGNDISKNIDILNSAQGYMLKNGKNDVFEFNPDYSGYYKFSAPSYSTIKLYENNQLLKTENGSLSYIFEKNKTYKFEVVIDGFPQNSRGYNVSIEPVKISNTGTYQLDNYIKNNSDNGIIKIYCSQNNIYNLEMYSLINNTKTPLNFSVYDSNISILQKFSLDEYQNTAESSNGTGSITINLEKEKYYYIIFDIDYNNSLYINWSNLNNDCNLDTSYSFTTNVGDKLSSINIPYTSRYEITFSYSNINLLSNNTAFILIKYNSNNDLFVEFFITCSESSGEITKEINLLKNDKIYFGYFNGVNYIDYTFMIIEDPLYEFTITTETNAATVDTGLGTEVTLNNGLRYNNTIAVGFTRVLYLGPDANYNSRYNDYIWSSSNPSIATVSAYGTVFAKSEGTVIIRVTDKYGQNNVAAIELNVYIKQTETILIQLSTDVNEDSSLNGTEVRQNGGLPGGTTISIGYTRSICIVSGGPTNIRQDYNWSSSNNSIATVDQYGIVHARSSGTVVITCINKYNSSYIGTITITIV